MIALVYSICLSLSFMSVCENGSAFLEFVGNKLPFRADGKIAIPRHIKHIKLDVGLSYSAPMSQQWLSQENNLWVFGFEPNPEAVSSIMSGAQKKHPSHGTPLEKKWIGNQFFLIPCALGISQGLTSFFITREDCGCSSLYEPKDFSIEKVIEVPVFSLSDFFDLFPFDTHPIIDYIKIDAQGSDLNIIKSAGHYLDHVIYVTLEAENKSYKDTRNSEDEIEAYMRSRGFTRSLSHPTTDPTYVNQRFNKYLKNHKVCIYQQG